MTAPLVRVGVVVRPSEAPSVRTLEEQARAAAAALARAEAELRDREAEIRSADALVRREARRRLPDAERAVEVAEDGVTAARRSLTAEVTALRGALLPTFKSRWSAAVKKLDAALVAAARANADLVSIAEEAREALSTDAGRAIDMSLVWGELADETPTVASKLASWRRAAGIVRE